MTDRHCDPGYVSALIKAGYYSADTYFDFRKHEEIQDWTNKSIEVYEAFKHDLAEAYDVSNNPKAEMVFNMAWEEERSNGHLSVQQRYAELVRLIKD